MSSHPQLLELDMMSRNTVFFFGSAKAHSLLFQHFEPLALPFHSAIFDPVRFMRASPLTPTPTVDEYSEQIGLEIVLSSSNNTTASSADSFLRVVDSLAFVLSTFAFSMALDASRSAMDKLSVDKNRSSTSSSMSLDRCPGPGFRFLSVRISWGSVIVNESSQPFSLLSLLLLRRGRSKCCFRAACSAWHCLIYFSCTHQLKMAQGLHNSLVYLCFHNIWTIGTALIHTKSFLIDLDEFIAPGKCFQDLERFNLHTNNKKGGCNRFNTWEFVGLSIIDRIGGYQKWQDAVLPRANLSWGKLLNFGPRAVNNGDPNFFNNALSRLD